MLPACFYNILSSSIKKLVFLTTRKQNWTFEWDQNFSSLMLSLSLHRTVTGSPLVLGDRFFFFLRIYLFILLKNDFKKSLNSENITGGVHDLSSWWFWSELQTVQKSPTSYLHSERRLLVPAPLVVLVVLVHLLLLRSSVWGNVCSFFPRMHLCGSWVDPSLIWNRRTGRDLVFWVRRVFEGTRVCSRHAVVAEARTLDVLRVGAEAASQVPPEPHRSKPVRNHLTETHTQTFTCTERTHVHKNIKKKCFLSFKQSLKFQKVSSEQQPKVPEPAGHLTCSWFYRRTCRQPEPRWTLEVLEVLENQQSHK